MTNHMAEVAKMFGVELGERFYIKDESDFSCTFYNDGLYVYPTKEGSCALPSSEQVLSRLLEGAIDIKRKPWKPKHGNIYYYVTSKGNILCDFFDSGFIRDINMYKLGNCYRSEKEAQTNKNKWIKFYASDEVLGI